MTEEYKLQDNKNYQDEDKIFHCQITPHEYLSDVLTIHVLETDEWFKVEKDHSFD